MKQVKIWVAVGLVGIGGLCAAMAVSNPDQAAYEAYATQEISRYLNKSVCPQAPKLLGNSLKDECVALVAQNRPQMREIIAAHTERQNFIFFSLYKTDLSIDAFLPSNVFFGSLLPAYHFETVGIFQGLYTYKIERR